MKILCIGPLWRGSNAGGLFRAFSRIGCLVDIVDEFYFVSLRGSGKLDKIIYKLIRPLQAKQFNDDIQRSIRLFKPQVVFVFKGTFVFAETLDYARQMGCKLVMFYPDVSMTAHGKYLTAAIPKYDLIFTTKTFGKDDLLKHFGIKKAFFVPHGYDPEIHRELNVAGPDKAIYACDASFIGTWSPKKEKYLTELKRQCPDIKLKVWGMQWEKASSPELKGSVQGGEILGDLYALAIQSSTINLGILSEQVRGASSGDRITSRTFHIPGANGFMLHERTEESVLYYKEDEEAAFFDSPEEMAEKVKYYLENADKRERVKTAGHQKAINNYSLDHRAKHILNVMKEEVL